MYIFVKFGPIEKKSMQENFYLSYRFRFSQKKFPIGSGSGFLSSFRFLLLFHHNACISRIPLNGKVNVAALLPNF